MGDLRGSFGRCVMGAVGGDEARFWSEDGQDGADINGRSEESTPLDEEVFFQRHTDVGYLPCGGEAVDLGSSLAQGGEQRVAGLRGGIERVFVLGEGVGLGEAIAAAAEGRASAWPRNEGSTAGLGEIDWLPEAAVDHDELPGVAATGFGNRLGSSGGGGASRGGPTAGLWWDALGAGKSGAVAAFTLHHDQRRLGGVCQLARPGVSPSVAKGRRRPCVDGPRDCPPEKEEGSEKGSLSHASIPAAPVCFACQA